MHTLLFSCVTTKTKASDFPLLPFLLFLNSFFTFSPRSFSLSFLFRDGGLSTEQAHIKVSLSHTLWVSLSLACLIVLLWLLFLHMRFASRCAQANIPNAFFQLCVPFSMCVKLKYNVGRYMKGPRHWVPVLIVCMCNHNADCVSFRHVFVTSCMHTRVHM